MTGTAALYAITLLLILGTAAAAVGLAQWIERVFTRLTNGKGLSHDQGY